LFRVRDRDILIDSTGEYETGRKDDERVIRCGGRQLGGNDDRVGKKSHDVVATKTMAEMAEGHQRGI
jgi:hypothetical protein